MCKKCAERERRERVHINLKALFLSEEDEGEALTPQPPLPPQKEWI